MKIQCDVCSASEASVYCSADEAALCAACDHRVHDANKLASKHERFSLVQPSDKQFPLCDICQEKRAFLFCQQDRAILCRDCDIPIHKSNEHTKSHNRFLLTGVKLSNYIDYSSVHVVPSQPLKTKKLSSSDSSQIYYPTPLVELNSSSSLNNISSTSTISEYLIETLPGWHVEDFLDSTPVPFGFSKIDDNGDFDSNLDCFPSENMGIWVPQTPSLIQTESQFSPYVNGKTGFKESKEATNMDFSNKKWRGDAFTVPQMSPPSASLKRSRLLW